TPVSSQSLTNTTTSGSSIKRFCAAARLPRRSCTSERRTETSSTPTSAGCFRDFDVHRIDKRIRPTLTKEKHHVPRTPKSARYFCVCGVCCRVSARADRGAQQGE